MHEQLLKSLFRSVHCILHDTIVCYRGTNIENKGKVQSEYDNLDVSLEVIEMKLHAESIDISKVRTMFS